MVGVCGKGHLGVSFLRGSMCAEGMGYGGLGGYFGEQGPFCVALFGLDVESGLHGEFQKTMDDLEHAY